RPGAPHALPSFPTRRSSDLSPAARTRPITTPVVAAIARKPTARMTVATRTSTRVNPSRIDDARTFIELLPPARAELLSPARCPRSEEHTSELQSRENLVCRL